MRNPSVILTKIITEYNASVLNFYTLITLYAVYGPENVVLAAGHKERFMLKV